MGLFDELDRALDHITEKSADLIEKETYEKRCYPLVTLQKCISWAKKMKERFPHSAAFLISVKENRSHKNENDLLVITLAMLDKQNHPVMFDASKGVSTVIYGKTIDSDLMNLLNGTESAILKF